MSWGGGRHAVEYIFIFGSFEAVPRVRSKWLLFHFFFFFFKIKSIFLVWLDGYESSVTIRDEVRKFRSGRNFSTKRYSQLY